LAPTIYKLNGAGNSFFFVFEAPFFQGKAYKDWAAELCMPEGKAITDGLMVLTHCNRETNESHILFFNPDGSEYFLCFNAMRCAVLLWHEITGSAKLTIHTQKTDFIGTFEEGRVTLAFEPWFAGVQPQAIHGHLGKANGWFIPHGDPHVALFDNDFDERDFLFYAHQIRHNLSISATGSNFHLVKDAAKGESNNGFRIRSFERGVEGETNACGSGCLAAAIVLNKNHGLTDIDFETKLGDTISVGVLPNGHWYLSGPAVLEYSQALETVQY